MPPACRVRTQAIPRRQAEEGQPGALSSTDLAAQGPGAHQRAKEEGRSVASGLGGGRGRPGQREGGAAARLGNKGRCVEVGIPGLGAAAQHLGGRKLVGAFLDSSPPLTCETQRLLYFNLFKR